MNDEARTPKTKTGVLSSFDLSSFGFRRSASHVLDHIVAEL